MTIMQTLEQRRARQAWDAVQQAKSTSPVAKEYCTAAKRLSVRIQMAGFGHAMAFANAKTGANKSVADDVARWVLHALKRTPAPDGPASQLMEQITRQDADWLRRATEEATGYLQWLVRFAEAELDTPENSAAGQGQPER